MHTIHTQHHGGGGGQYYGWPMTMARGKRWTIYIICGFSIRNMVWTENLMNIGYTVTWIQADIDLAVCKTMVQNGYSFHPGSPGSSTNNGLTFRWWTEELRSAYSNINNQIQVMIFCPTWPWKMLPNSPNLVMGWSSNVIYVREAIAGQQLIPMENQGAFSQEFRWWMVMVPKYCYV